MQRNHVLSSILSFAGLCAVATSQGQFHANAPSKAGKCFIENIGQWDSSAQFLARASGVDLWITDNGIVMNYHEFVPSPDQKQDMRDKSWQPKGTTRGDVLTLTLEGSQPTAVSGRSRLPGDFNYFIGNNPGQWATHVPRFEEARSESPYKAISIRYYFDGGTPRYDVVVKPGADLSQVSFKIEGAQAIRVTEDGSLELATPYGRILEKGLTAYQETGGQRTAIPCRMAVDGDHLRFDAGQYDPSKPLLIDPLIFSTYVGGSDEDYPTAIAIDSAGHPVVAGWTSSTDFPVTTGAYQTTNKGGSSDGFVVKLSADGKKLLSGTYLGGSGWDEISGLALDGADNPVLCGTTESADFPTTSGVVEKSAVGNQWAFVSKLSADGTKLLASTYLGEEGQSVANALALDGSSNPVVVGWTNSADFPVTLGAFQSTLKGSNVFITKLSADENSVVASTFLGGSSWDHATAVVLDKWDNCVVAGTTDSNDFPTTAGAYQSSAGTVKGQSCAFVSRISADGTKLLASTYLHGGNDSYGYGLALDATGSPVVVGLTDSPDFPVTPGAYQDSSSLGEYDNGYGFVSKLSANETTLLAGTWLGGHYITWRGGSDESWAEAISFDLYGNWVVSGIAGADFPVTAGASQTSFGGDIDGYVARISPDATTLISSTFLGGSGDDQVEAMAISYAGNALVAGWTSSTDFPVTSGAFQPVSMSHHYTGFVSELGLAPFYLVTPATVYGPDQFQATLIAAKSGSLVSLTATPPSLVSLPTQVAVAQGQHSVKFNMSVPEVSSATVIQITGNSGGSKETWTFTILPITIASVNVPLSFVGGSGTTGSVTCTSSFTGQGGVVSLSSNKVAAATVPPTVTIPAGSNQATFPISTSLVAQTTAVQITATYQGASKVATLNVQPITSIKNLTLQTPCVGGATATGVISTTGHAGKLGGIVQLWTNDPNATVPSTVTIPAGGSGATFSVKTASINYLRLRGGLCFVRRRHEDGNPNHFA